MTSALPAAAQSAGEDPFSLMRGTQEPGVKRTVSFEARLTQDGAVMRDGLTWRVFKSVPDASGRLELVASAEGGSKTIELPAGEYFVNCAFGRASTTRKVAVPRTGEGKVDVALVLEAGGLVLNATLGDDSRADPDLLRFTVYEDRGDKRELVIEDLKPETILRLRAGTYEIVSYYGDLNAEAHARLKVKAGEITEATLKQHAAVVTLTLASEKGGEALADTSWTVLGASGDVLTESRSAYPSMILAEGEYTAIARNKDSVYEKNFTVAPVKSIQVELLLDEDKAELPDESVD
ncbi:hypothetical protein FF124_15545 [Martelella lutilitoris]|uniref:Carboxypeptidase regulatory-like domain-containing protein n=2 Tax=Martelella lutilitoris TaxID=2583532 RepID=A0A5C4JNS2_9HYPH|nr:hypothetical protein FF124_15545 [Martelella lutilitoris]